MIKNTLSVIAILSLLVAIGCHPESADQSQQQTSTISPATPPPATDTDSVLTQTTEIGDSRSANEGPAEPTGTPAVTPSPAHKASPKPTATPRKH